MTAAAGCWSSAGQFQRMPRISHPIRLTAYSGKKDQTAPIGKLGSMGNQAPPPALIQFATVAMISLIARAPLGPCSASCRSAWQSHVSPPITLPGDLQPIAHDPHRVGRPADLAGNHVIRGGSQQSQFRGGPRPAAVGPALGPRILDEVLPDGPLATQLVTRSVLATDFKLDLSDTWPRD